MQYEKWGYIFWCLLMVRSSATFALEDMMSFFPFVKKLKYQTFKKLVKE
jgi:hypothetical protein